METALHKQGLCRGRSAVDSEAESSRARAAPVPPARPAVGWQGGPVSHGTRRCAPSGPCPGARGPPCRRARGVVPSSGTLEAVLNHARPRAGAARVLFGHWRTAPVGGARYRQPAAAQPTSSAPTSATQEIHRNRDGGRRGRPARGNMSGRGIARCVPEYRRPGCGSYRRADSYLGDRGRVRAASRRRHPGGDVGGR
jgi:hypothetical protein